MKKRILAIMSLIASISFAEAATNRIGERIDISSIHSNTQNGSESRSESISADITGHVLTITFNDNVGIAHIVIKDSNGVYIDRDNVFSTPDHATFIITDCTM